MLDTIVSLPMRLKQRVALSVLAALLLFAATAVWLQFTRDDLNWQRATLSLYLHGPQGMLLRVAYCVLASAIVVLGLALYMDMHGPARRSLPLMLFGAAGLGLATVAVGDSCRSTPLCWHRWYMRWLRKPPFYASPWRCWYKHGASVAMCAGVAGGSWQGGGHGWHSLVCGCTCFGAAARGGWGRSW